MKYLKFSQKILKFLFLSFILYWPLMRYQFGFNSAAAPDLWLIILFIFINDYQYSQWQLFLLSLILDNLYSLPNGVSYIAVISAIHICKLISIKIKTQNPIFKSINFAIFAFIIYIFKYIVLIKHSPLSNIWPQILFEYLFTTITFPIVNISKHYFLDNVK